MKYSAIGSKQSSQICNETPFFRVFRYIKEQHQTGLTRRKTASRRATPAMTTTIIISSKRTY